MPPPRRPLPPRVAQIGALLLLGAVVGWRGASPAWAASEPPPSETVAITKLPFLGLTSEVAAELLNNLRATLRRSGFSLLSAADVENRLAHETQLLGCSTPSCYSRMAQVLGVRRVIEGEVQRLELSTFAMKLQLRDLLTGQLTAQPVQERCDVCSSEDVKQMVERAAERLTQAAPPRGPQAAERPMSSGTLLVETLPPGAQVSIDNRARFERTPATFLLAAGVHNLKLQGAGYRTLRQRVEIPPGQPVTLKLELTPLPQRRPWLTALSVLTSVGAIGLAVGTGILSYYNNQPVNSADCPPQSDPKYHCMYKYDNTSAMIVTGIGASLLGIGAIITLYFDNAAPQRRPIVEQPGSTNPPPEPPEGQP